MSELPGYIPGFHLPGTLIPIGAIAAQQQAIAARQRAEEADAQALLLLLLRS